MYTDSIVRITLLVIALMLSGCAKEVWHRQEVVDWCQMSHPPEHLRYRGSDAKWHYFIAHPTDEWVFMKVNRSEIHIAREMPLATFPRWHYEVDPASDFQRIDE